jgi:hypothetical protein
MTATAKPVTLGWALDSEEAIARCAELPGRVTRKNYSILLSENFYATL